MDLYYMDYGKRYVPVKHHIIVHNGVLAYTPTKLSAPGFWEVGAQCARADKRRTGALLNQICVHCTNQIHRPG